MRSLSVKLHLVLLFCVLVNVFLGWQFFGVLVDNDVAGDYDDNVWYRDLSQRQSIGEIFDPTRQTGNEYRDSYYVPVQSLLFHLSASVLGERFRVARYVVLWFHVLNGVLVLFLAFRFTRSIPISQLASLLFMFHPANAGAVSWLSAAVSHAIPLFFYLVAFMLMQSFLHRRTWWRMALALPVAAVAVLTKENAATLFAVVLLYDLLVVTGLRALWPIRRRVYLGLLARHLGLLLVALASIALQLVKYEGGAVATKFGGVELGSRVVIRIVELLALVFHLSGDWSPEVLLNVMAAVAIALLAGLYLARRKPVILFFILAIVVFQAPFAISNFRSALSLGRYIYQVNAFVAVLFAILAARALGRWPTLRWPALNLAVAALSFMVYRVSQTLE